MKKDELMSMISKIMELRGHASQQGLLLCLQFKGCDPYPVLVTGDARAVRKAVEDYLKDSINPGLDWYTMTPDAARNYYQNGGQWGYYIPAATEADR